MRNLTMFKFYVLWSKNVTYLETVTRNLPPENTIIVINTLLKDEEKLGVSFAETHGIEYHVTESDGTPATGKNSVLDLFLASDNEYMVQIDGDDYLTDHGVYLYQELAKHPMAPDMVCLYRQSAIAENGIIFCPFYKSGQRLDYDILYNLFSKKPRYKKYRHLAHQWAMDRLEFDEFMYEHMESDEFLCRMVFHSRYVASLMRYNNELFVGEDTLQFLKLKKMALNGELLMLRRKERGHQEATYIYNDFSKGIMRDMYNDNWGWTRQLLDTIYKEKDLPKNASLPDFNDKDWGLD